MIEGKMMGKERIGVATQAFSSLGFNPAPIFFYHFAPYHFAEILLFLLRIEDLCAQGD